MNNDPGNEQVKHALMDRDIRIFTPREYILACRHAAAIVGNSSSGIIEAPTLEVPTVNICPRQDGRLKGRSIFLTVREDTESIGTTIQLAIGDEGPLDNPYGEPGASERIADILTSIELEGVMVKRHAN